MIMGTTISNTQIDKRKKLLDLPEDVITVLSVQAAKEGKSAKAFMEGLLISAANDLEDITTYTFLSKNQPEGHVMVSEAEQKAFEVDKLSGKVLSSVLDMIREVKNANGIDEITNCKKLIAYKSVYRIRIGDYRAFFIFHVKIVDDTVKFEYLVSRGEAYDKKVQSELRKKDK